jgi:hypothetical protein
VRSLPRAAALPEPTANLACAVCADGYGGSLQTEDPTESGCRICGVGQFGAGLGLRTNCGKCSAAGLTAYSDKPGAAACSKCTNAQAANTAGTGCGKSPLPGCMHA